MTASPFDHPFLSGLLGDDEIAPYFSAEADIRAMLSFEAALAKAEAAHGLIPAEAARRMTDTCAAFSPDVSSLRSATARDGVVVPDLVKQLRADVGEEAAKSLHLGATSQDVIDTSLMIRLKAVVFLFAGRLSAIAAGLDALDGQFGRNQLMGHTRMQAAIPITVADRLNAWRAPLTTYRDRLTEQSFPVQFGGAAGTLDKLGSQAAAIRASLAQELGLTDAPQWQSGRQPIADIAGLFASISGSLGKMGQDIALLAQAGDEIEISGGGTSSAMAHKQNPVSAEVLVSLARFNATVLSGIHQSLVHEQERSGAAWTLEWLLLPQMTMATAASLRLAGELTGNIKSLGTA
ncbi:3-carboxy-cis,cis-muconate cycloisomerase [Rhizobium leguminosarum bv. viciae]|uniref:3-carboxy-cis,cis-muconate cycloisomerase n=1 Tax=Rhizobium leguminosarum TaxID=384 RepID=UPI00103D3259|nr:3-carboxy-cis,cis-muconate cycloisomerase [Rhizobium leguminosarum]MBY5470688.1 3-carboxy-cis,cis-muconate cycloisomerase [Rhizobium leguminosarum]TBZ46519.1 3-carboxy-cis,cis-muconate cycloisomerase [Rhizobium leguminosarum bv. viciae]TBZ93559.1 3-carboxy-cis,cis-muconate cycloisomerase [Rhizobium leguminosarum bv. viciae]TCA19194.1 3-carboxy-cis,cis-muconate cycloisomerase [Rhizobium leguminosarum bv. viciae]TCA22918.1 3-carboxy-cis,cis-muconate cycloisomerase [Rhizobium leguminosarum bv.